MEWGNREGIRVGVRWGNRESIRWENREGMGGGQDGHRVGRKGESWVGCVSMGLGGVGCVWESKIFGSGTMCDLAFCCTSFWGCSSAGGEFITPSEVPELRPMALPILPLSLYLFLASDTLTLSSLVMFFCRKT